MYKQPSGAQHRRRQAEREARGILARVPRKPSTYDAQGLLVLLVDAVIAYLYNPQTGQERLRQVLDSCETFLDPQLMDHLPWSPDGLMGTQGTRGLLVLGGEGK